LRTDLPLNKAGHYFENNHAFSAMDIHKQAELNMKLFLTYLKNQTPDDKVDTQQMMNTMLTMMTASQQLAAHQTLKDIHETQKNSHHMGMMRYVGSEAMVPTDQISFDSNPITIKTQLPSLPDDACIMISDCHGHLVRRIPLDHHQDIQTVTWDGLDDKGEHVPQGRYQIVGYMKDSDHQELTIPCSSYVSIDEIDNRTQKLLSKGQEIDMKNVQSFRKPKISPFLKS
jgi:flagellar hook assembly protein FlgD